VLYETFFFSFHKQSFINVWHSVGISGDNKQIDILLFMKPPFKFPFLHSITSLKSTRPPVCMAILIFAAALDQWK